MVTRWIVERSRCFNFDSFNLDLNLDSSIIWYRLVEESIAGGGNVGLPLKIGRPREYVHVVAEEALVSIFDGSSKFRGTA